MRALLIVNPHATSTTRLRRDVIVRALSSAVELEVVETRYRGHATSLAAAALDGGFGIVLTLGGDGTVNEAVNGILGPPAGLRTEPAGRAGVGRLAGTASRGGRASAGGHAGSDREGAPLAPGAARRAADVGSLPALAPLPGGNANVFTRAVGLPQDPVDAAGRILQALAEGRSRSVSLGLAGDRYFTFNAGLGLDAEVVRAVDGRRAGGRTARPALYVRMTLQQFYGVTDRRDPALTLERPGQRPDGPVFAAVVSNTAPWTYLGRRPINPSPQASFDTGLDVLALSSLSSVTTIRAVRQMLSTSGRTPRGRHVLSLHDQAELTLRSARPAAFQLDGEYMGERESVSFLSVPDALRVIALFAPKRRGAAWSEESGQRAAAPRASPAASGEGEIGEGRLPIEKHPGGSRKAPLGKREPLSAGRTGNVTDLTLKSARTFAKASCGSSPTLRGL